MKIVISSYHVPISVATALIRAGRRMGHDVFVAGLSSGATVPWPDAPTEFAAEAKFVATPGACEGADLWIDVDGGYYDSVARRPKHSALVLTDPHIGKDTPDALSPSEYAELGVEPLGVAEIKSSPWWDGEDQRRAAAAVGSKIYCMQEANRRPNEALLPYAHDPEWYGVVEPLQIPGGGAAVATILGAPYLERHLIAKRLNAAHLLTIGPGRGLAGPMHARGLCAAPVAVVWPVRDDLPGRTWEALACGRVLVLKDVPGSDRLGDHPWIIRVRHRDGVGGAVRSALEVAKEYPPEHIAQAHAGQTWDARLQQIIDGRACL